MAEIFASKTAEIEEREVINAQISRKLAGECMVLLENDGALPIHTKKVALFGNGARATIKGGTGYQHGFFYSLVEGSQIGRAHV